MLKKLLRKAIVINGLELAVRNIYVFEGDGISSLWIIIGVGLSYILNE